MLRTGLFVAGLCLASAASSATLNSDMNDRLRDLTDGHIQDVATIPTPGMQIVETSHGMIAMTTNGRFAIQGTLYDTWSMDELRTAEEVRRARSHIDTDALNLDMSSLAPLTLGASELPSVTVFVDPACGSCAPLIRQMRNLRDRYRFEIVLIGIETPQSGPLVPRLICADSNAAIQALESQEYDALVREVPDDCDLRGARRALIVARVFNIARTPFLIAPDGQVADMAPGNLKRWLDQHAL